MQAVDNVNGLFSNDIQYLPKRAPSGFFGMRGKKFFFDWYGTKRAPMGFMGMRGKKNENDDISYENSIDHPEYDSDFYEKLQIERKLLTDFLKSQNEKDLESYWNKRAPSQGFMGMRGKKYFGDEWDSIQDQLEKRAPMGFQGNF